MAMEKLYRKYAISATGEYSQYVTDHENCTVEKKLTLLGEVVRTVEQSIRPQNESMRLLSVVV